MSEKQEGPKWYQSCLGRLLFIFLFYLFDQAFLDGWVTLFVTSFLVSEIGVHFGMEPF